MRPFLTVNGNINKGNKVLELQLLITNMEDPQVEVILLWSCLHLCKIDHLRIVSSDLIWYQFYLLDNGFCSTLSTIFYGSTIADINWHQSTLPFGFGGLGISEASTSAPAASVASVTHLKFIICFVMPSIFVNQTLYRNVHQDSQCSIQLLKLQFNDLTAQLDF